MADAEKIAAIPLPVIAAREAYIACLHAANAYLLEVSGDVPRSHKGVHFEFRKACMAEDRISLRHAEALQKLYRIKENTDYGDRSMVTVESLPDIMQSARDLIAAVRQAIERDAG